VLGRVSECTIGPLRCDVVSTMDAIGEGGPNGNGLWKASLPRCTEKTLEPGKKWRHRWNRAGVCLDCGDVSHRAVRIKKAHRRVDLSGLSERD
jgi:hypothetical protein